ncbi:hypothetical protein [Cupriavidus numazuensis]|uniref:Uncharacterized protein n=1 Tax=Cupriavidus numazuensis TaxID=221992 RepID=A0ABM8TAV7_9BURK|nr:hypothetical protein [Cupriavidus numazuensis]CAG2132235.1 hypothetical protein LMG26411_00580 [Cupriavidus numazuensis]
MKRGEDFICDFERRHPILFGWILTMLIVVFYIAAGDSSTLFALTGSPQ